jgi:mRNA interferase RelE/StbE
LAYNVIYKKSVQRDLKQISPAEITRILSSIENELRTRPENNPVLKGRFAGLRKFRIGDYRVIYVMMGTDVVILRIGNRKDVYKGGPPGVAEE